MAVRNRHAFLNQSTIWLLMENIGSVTSAAAGCHGNRGTRIGYIILGVLVYILLWVIAHYAITNYSKSYAAAIANIKNNFFFIFFSLKKTQHYQSPATHRTSSVPATSPGFQSSFWHYFNAIIKLNYCFVKWKHGSYSPPCLLESINCLITYGEHSRCPDRRRLMSR